MINLIPSSARRFIVKEYWLRVVSVWFFLLIFALILAFSLQAPTYILITSLNQAMISQFDQVEAQHGEFSELEEEIIQANALVKHLEDHPDGATFSELIYELDAIAGSGVVLSQFSMKREDSTLKTINIVGTATTRITLSDFRDAIEASARFEKADLPISNLAKERDISFSMTITLTK